MAQYNYRENKPCVAVPNDIFSRLCEVKNKLKPNKGQADSSATLIPKGSDVVQAFTLYFVLLLRMDYERNAEIQMKLLMERYFTKPRPEHYPDINRYLYMLKTAKLINYSVKDNGKDYTGKDIISVSIDPIEKNYSLISCVNEKLIKKYPSQDANTAFALHCLLNTRKQDPRDKWEIIEISEDKLKGYLSVEKNNVRDSSNLLFKEGFIHKPPTENYTTEGGDFRTHCLTYTVHDFDEPIDITKSHDGRERQKIARQVSTDLANDIRGLMESQNQTPILLIGKYVDIFHRLCSRDSNVQNRFALTRYIIGFDDIAWLKVNINGITLSNGMFVTLILEKPYLQDRLLKFIEENPQLPIVVLSKKDNITAPFMSRFKSCLKKSAEDDVREIRLSPIHKGYDSYYKQNRFYNIGKMMNHAFINCPELMIPTVTNSQSNTAISQIDYLISKLTVGKMYIDMLDSESDPSADIPIETKYLSLALMRDDLAKMSVCEYETAIQAHITED